MTGARQSRAALVGGLLGALAGYTYARFRRDTRRTETWLRANSCVVDTARGPMEVATVGDGPALLFSHGATGGYDQSLQMARLIHGYRVIAPSRPGYLRTPLATGRTPAEQADAYAALLDTLGMRQVAIIGGSGGGPSALRFALQHAARCWALVMVSAVWRMPPPSTVRTYWLWARLMHSDFAMWAITHLTLHRLIANEGGGEEARARLRADSEAFDIVRGLIQLHPTRTRVAGLVNDLLQADDGLNFEGLEDIRLPTLIIHGDDDPIVPVSQAKSLAERIPGAHLLTVAEAGHLCIATHRAETIPVLDGFLQRHAPRDG